MICCFTPSRLRSLTATKTPPLPIALYGQLPIHWAAAAASTIATLPRALHIRRVLIGIFDPAGCDNDRFLRKQHSTYFTVFIPCRRRIDRGLLQRDGVGSPRPLQQCFRTFVSTDGLPRTRHHQSQTKGALGKQASPKNSLNPPKMHLRNKVRALVLPMRPAHPQPSRRYLESHPRAI